MERCRHGDYWWIWWKSEIVDRQNIDGTTEFAKTLDGKNQGDLPPLLIDGLGKQREGKGKQGYESHDRKSQFLPPFLLLTLCLTPISLPPFSLDCKTIFSPPFCQRKVTAPWQKKARKGGNFRFLFFLVFSKDGETGVCSAWISLTLGLFLARLSIQFHRRCSIYKPPFSSPIHPLAHNHSPRILWPTPSLQQPHSTFPRATFDSAHKKVL